MNTGEIIYPNKVIKSEYDNSNVLPSGYWLKSMFFPIFFFPMSILLFVYFITMISLSLGLSITFIGLPLLYFTYRSIPVIINSRSEMFEVYLSFRQPRIRQKSYNGGFFDNLKRVLGDKQIYGGMTYILLSFILGIVYFAFTITLGTVSITLMLSFLYIPIRAVLQSSGIETSDQVIMIIEDIVPFWMIIGFLMIIGVLLFAVFAKMVQIIPRIDAKLLDLLI